MPAVLLPASRPLKPKAQVLNLTAGSAEPVLVGLETGLDLLL